MKRLRTLREQFGMTQKALADRLDTTQQTVGRWETGRAQPSVAVLRDIAVLFGVSLDYLLGHPAASRDTSRFVVSPPEDRDLSGYWGNIGLLHPHDEKTKWYPISHQELRHAYASVQHSGTTQIPVKTETLNNRLLIFRPQALERVWFLDEACDQPDDDWDVGFDEVEGMPPEVYGGLEMYLNESDSWERETTAHFRGLIEGIVRENNLDTEVLRRLLEYTFIRTTGGRTFEYIADAADLLSLACSCEETQYGELEPVFRLNADFDLFESFYCWDQLAYVDAPLRQYSRALQEEFREMTEDSLG